MEKIRIENENNEKKAADENAKYEKMKKRIKIVFIKPEVFKKKRNNIGGFITVDPNILEKEKVTEIEEVPIKKEEEEKPENPIEEGEKIENEEGKEEQKKENIDEALLNRVNLRFNEYKCAIDYFKNNGLTKQQEDAILKGKELLSAIKKIDK